MTYFLLSAIGFISAHRIMYRFEKFFFMKRKKSIGLFAILIFPLFIFGVFKEHTLLLALYIGLILLSLIFFSLILEKKLKKVFESLHLNFINSLLLHIKAGNSTQKSITESFLGLSMLENILFEPFRSILRPDFELKALPHRWTHFYFLELQQILRSETRVADQLELFKRGLKIKNKFIQRQQQVTRQIKAQALVAGLVYVTIFILAFTQLDLMSCPITIIISLVLFLLGIGAIFKLGGRIKWRI